MDYKLFAVFCSPLTSSQRDGEATRFKIRGDVSVKGLVIRVVPQPGQLLAQIHFELDGVILQNQVVEDQDEVIADHCVAPFDVVCEELRILQSDDHLSDISIRVSHGDGDILVHGIGGGRAI
jgi:hypothetical protein